ncbi:MAG: response regulator transcription factor [Ferrovum sp.]|nr:response regulator transcription factor [Ferrovum sp.]
MHLLIIEDDLDLGRSLQQCLRAEGLSSEWLRRSADARHVVRQNTYDCILLDLTLPDGSGLDLLRSWRAAGLMIPIIMITARQDLEDRLAGLDGGADDFVLKPFIPIELVSRIRAVIRRYAQQVNNEWGFGNIRIDTRLHLVQVAGQPLELSPREFHILLELVRGGGAVVSKDELSRRLQPLGDPVDFSAIEVHIHNLRRKIGVDVIQTVRGIGYRLES